MDVLPILSSLSAGNITFCVEVGTVLHAVGRFRCLRCLVEASFSSRLRLSSAKTSPRSNRQAVSLLRCRRSAFPFAVICRISSLRWQLN
ncbi:unnamed protein product [Tuber melanosporum]|uniref:(Perigord truffle) hypothetical protein n=1 Tax=Tuber melanosporum (strain Mel28) TaxID=656061 RepID=D5GAP1_TUBMM|nr:uncharacterized protein GSTUM_00003710001 [Tuber melanosporum]CAZ81584.1 unnamed protein product [Tuber melanosporum]